VDLLSFVAGPTAAIILPDFGVDSSNGTAGRRSAENAYKVPPQPHAKDERLELSTFWFVERQEGQS
jgi:hypothetical protein